jgi:hypothetical protein
MNRYLSEYYVWLEEQTAMEQFYELLCSYATKYSWEK